MSEDTKSLQLEATIGFGGSVANGLNAHPDGDHLVYPLGSTVVIQSRSNPRDQKFLQGHTNTISCVTMSKSGKYIASGQITHMGFQADIILWDFEKRTQISRFTLHKAKVEALAFSPNDLYLVSLGGEDDNTVIVWDLTKKIAVCGAPASKESSGLAKTVCYSGNNDLIFITGGNSTIRVWDVDVVNRKVRPLDCALGQIKRVVTSVLHDGTSGSLYCGTTTGDLLEISLKTRNFKQSGPPKEKDRFSVGVVCVALCPDKKHILIGAGDGTIAALDSHDKLRIVKSAKVIGKITSLTFSTENNFFVGTEESSIYSVHLDSFKPVLHSTCHYSGINDLCFADNYSELFATCSLQDIRVWNALNCSELLRITVPNLVCNCIAFKKDGSSLISGWSDGKIRAFGPQTGRCQYTINDVHTRGVTALAVTDAFNARGDFRIVSGGEDGQVRIWKVTKEKQTLENAMKEHKETVTSIKLRRNNSECVSSSTDGSCIIWDIIRCVRNQVMFAPSFFMAVSYYPDESQILTSGTDRKIAYWENFDGSLIREIEGSQSDAINGLDISADGKYFVIGGSDKLVKFYRYEEGDVVFIGEGHSADIRKVKFSPDQKYLVSVSADGAIFKWKISVKIDTVVPQVPRGSGIQFQIKA